MLDAPSPASHPRAREATGRRLPRCETLRPSAVVGVVGGAPCCLLQRWGRRGQGQGGAEADHVVRLRRRRAEGRAGVPPGPPGGTEPATRATQPPRASRPWTMVRSIFASRSRSGGRHPARADGSRADGHAVRAPLSGDYAAGRPAAQRRCRLEGTLWYRMLVRYYLELDRPCEMVATLLPSEGPGGWLVAIIQESARWEGELMTRLGLGPAYRWGERRDRGRATGALRRRSARPALLALGRAPGPVPRGRGGPSDRPHGT